MTKAEMKDLMAIKNTLESKCEALQVEIKRCENSIRIDSEKTMLRGETFVDFGAVESSAKLAKSLITEVTVYKDVLAYIDAFIRNCEVE